MFVQLQCLSVLVVQNWVSFGKVAHDLVMRIQKIDGDNYPEVVSSLHETSSHMVNFIRYSDIGSFSTDIASDVHS